MKTHSTMLKDLHGGMHTLHIVFKVRPSERRVSVLVLQAQGSCISHQHIIPPPSPGPVVRH